MKAFFCMVFVFIPSLFGQKSAVVTVSKQDGTAVLSGLRKLTGYTVTACSSDGKSANLGGGAVWQTLERQGFAPIPPIALGAVNSKHRARSKWETAATITSEVSWAAAQLFAGNIPVCRASAQGCKAMRMIPVWMAHELVTLKAERDSVDPDPAKIFAAMLLDPSGSIAIPAGEGICAQRIFLTRAKMAVSFATFSVALN